MFFKIFFTNWWSLMGVMMLAGACIARVAISRPKRRIRERIRVVLVVLCSAWGLLVAVESRRGLAQLLTEIGHKIPWWISVPSLLVLYWLALGDLIRESVRDNGCEEIDEIHWGFLLIAIAATDVASCNINSRNIAFLGAYALIAAVAMGFYYFLEFLAIRRPTINSKPRF